MLTRRPSWYAPSRASRSRNPLIRAFTLIEVLVVVAIIALLVAILLPSLSSARDYAKEVVCGAHLHGMGNGLHNYLYVSKDWLPGLNTSGVAASSVKNDHDLLQESHIPVQTFDWMTPLIDDMTLPAKRAERFSFLLEHYKCPALLDTPSTIYAEADLKGEDKTEVEKIKHWTPVSYLMPVYFQYWGEKHTNTTLGMFAGRYPIKAVAPPDFYDARLDGYQSRINQVGTPAGKVFVADGTRYLDNTGVLDFDPSPFPTHYGAFTSGGAWRAADVAYGVKGGTPKWSGGTVGEGSMGGGKNLFLSYRHRVHTSGDGSAKGNKGLINMLFFDGHVDLTSDRDSRDVDFWYPKGAVIKDHLSGMTEVPQNYVVN